MPDKKAFYSEFNLGDITDKDYTHAQKVFERFKLKNLGDYHHDLYVQSDILLLADVLETSALKYMKLILLIFLSAPGLAWQVYLKRTEIFVCYYCLKKKLGVE